ncbi:hypothetical protein J6590_070906 [Homalodisca vitripennis]|nr:hypothetical protein J6590_070906 [Homalodisca vitripennis]
MKIVRVTRAVLREHPMSRSTVRYKPIYVQYDYLVTIPQNAAGSQPSKGGQSNCSSTVTICKTLHHKISKASSLAEELRNQPCGIQHVCELYGGLNNKFHQHDKSWPVNCRQEGDITL